jgi:hypothetical protein
MRVNITLDDLNKDLATIGDVIAVTRHLTGLPGGADIASQCADLALRHLVSIQKRLTTATPTDQSDSLKRLARCASAVASAAHSSASDRIVDR